MEVSAWLLRGSWGPLNARLSWARGDKNAPEVCMCFSGSGVKKRQREPWCSLPLLHSPNLSDLPFLGGIDKDQK